LVEGAVGHGARLSGREEVPAGGSPRTDRAGVATDGSDASRAAGRAAAECLGTHVRLVLVTVAPVRERPGEYAGGIEGPLLDPETAQTVEREVLADAHRALSITAEALEPRETEQRVERGDAGPSICSLAEELDAAARAHSCSLGSLLVPGGGARATPRARRSWRRRDGRVHVSSHYPTGERAFRGSRHSGSARSWAGNPERALLASAGAALVMVNT
jgi:nucleotide-binding universal stress UspA family protein